jgi:molecular chaperone HscB
MPSQTDNPRSTAPAKCDTCNGSMTSPVFCDNCRSLYPADGLNHFELLGFPPTFNIDSAALRQSYLRLSRGIHPDHHGGDDSTVSMRLSAQLNEAHRVLADPVLRAEYLLELVGGKSAREDKSVLDGVLAETLMLREEIAEAKGGGDPAALERCRVHVRRSYDATLAKIVALAGELPGDEALRRQLRATSNSMKYYQRLLSEV